MMRLSHTYLYTARHQPVAIISPRFGIRDSHRQDDNPDRPRIKEGRLETAIKSLNMAYPPRDGAITADQYIEWLKAFNENPENDVFTEPEINALGKIFVFHGRVIMDPFLDPDE